jgi:peptidoglycan/LPS O-acetylase OafA/YrhL
LDGVRGAAIALVLIYHYVDIELAPGSRALLGSQALFYAFLPTRLMWAGVDLFFVLSGFLIGGILLDNRSSPRYYSVFYARRIFRIFPIYYLMVGAVAIGAAAWPLSPLFRGDMPLWAFPLYAQNLLGDYTLAPDAIEVTWSLAVEEQFYLLFPLILKLSSRTTLLYILGTCTVGAPLLRGALILNGWGFEQVYVMLPTRADTLALGVIAAVIVRSERARGWVANHSAVLYGALCALILTLPTMLKWTSYEYVGTIGYSLLGVTFFLLILLLLLAPHPLLRAVFSAGWLRWLGMVSYCVYLVHHPLKIGLFLILLPGRAPLIADVPSFAVTVLALAVTLAIAQISWLVIEKPLIRHAHARYQY